MVKYIKYIVEACSECTVCNLDLITFKNAKRHVGVSRTKSLVAEQPNSEWFNSIFSSVTGKKIDYVHLHFPILVVWVPICSILLTNTPIFIFGRCREV